MDIGGNLVFDEVQLKNMKKVIPTMRAEGRSADISIVCDDPMFKGARSKGLDYNANPGKHVGDKDEIIRKLHLKQQFLNVEWWGNLIHNKI